MYVERKEQQIDTSPELLFRSLEEAFTAVGFPLLGWLRPFFTGLTLHPLTASNVSLTKLNLYLPNQLHFWEIEAIEPNAMVLLKASFPLVGMLWIRVEVEEQFQGDTHLIQTIYFKPTRFTGRILWNILSPLVVMLLTNNTEYVAWRAQRSSGTPSSLVLVN